MFDIGWPELLVIAIVLIVVVGPKDLPPMLRAFGKTTAKLRSMAAEFRGQFDEALREAELDDVKKTINEARRLNPLQSVRDAVNPLKATGDSIRSDLEKSVRAPSKSTEPAAKTELPEPAMKLSDGPPTVAIPKPAAAETPAEPGKASRTARAKPADAAPKAKPASAKTSAARTSAAKPAVSKAEPRKKAAPAPVQPRKSAKPKAAPARRGKASGGEGAA